MTGKVMCPCEDSDVRKGRQKKTCKECAKYEKRDSMLLGICVLIISCFFFSPWPTVFAFPVCGFLTLVSSFLKEYHSNQILGNHSYFSEHRRTGCEYCFKRTQRKINKNFIHSVIWNQKLANWLLKKKKE